MTIPSVIPRTAAPMTQGAASGEANATLTNVTVVMATPSRTRGNQRRMA